MKLFLSDPLVPLTTHQWQVVAKNSSGESEGPEWMLTTEDIMVGDINNNGEVNLVDAILALQVLTGQNPAGIRSDYASSGADVNRDGERCNEFQTLPTRAL